MNKQSASSLHFQRKISDFCQARIFPIVSRQEFESIHSYLINLILYRKKPPMRGNGIDWRAVAEACGIENKLSPELRQALRPGFEAIIRRFVDFR